ncbi:MAG: hypothetical protein GC134_03730 [Proteobacteria bacterium]|nr:hypothetical protein [Pseudomonadota bacterium]
MSVIIVPQHRATTKLRSYTAVTPGGRKLELTITGAVDITDQALEADLKAALTPKVADTVKVYNAEAPRGLFLSIGVWVLGWMLAIIGMGVATSRYGRGSIVDSWVPFFAGKHLPFDTPDVMMFAMTGSVILVVLGLGIGLVSYALSGKES